MTDSDHDIAKLVIVGGGTAGWMAAAALSRYLRDGRRQFVLVESDAIGTVGVGEATIPSIREYNALVGINENEFLKATQGTFKLGIEFVNWGKIGDRYLHPFGDFGREFSGIPFHQAWLRERERGNPGDLSEYSMSTVAAKMGRFARPARDAKAPLNQLNYAFHFDASLYARFLRGIAEKQGVIREEGKIVEVLRDGESGNVTGVRLDNGSVISGDFFIDCSGFRSLLLGETLGVGFEDWSHWLPVNRALAAPTANTGPADPFTRSTAHGAGWQWRIPLQHRTGNGHVYCSDHISDDEAEQVLRDNLEGEILADPRPIRFTTGRRKQSWSHNVVALGLSSGFLEPLESTSIYLIQFGIFRILALFPDRDISPVERDEFNRNMDENYDNVRDFVILHYKATQRDDTPFWRYVRDMEVPESLQHKIDLWKLHGRTPFRKILQLFTQPSWVAVMLGQNIWPGSYDPMANSLDPARIAQLMKEMREAYSKTASKMPTQEEFLKKANAWAAEDERIGMMAGGVTAR